MKTSRDPLHTQITNADRKTLSEIIELLGPLVSLEPIGHYASMTAEEVWLTLVIQVCVMGSARPIGRLQSNTARYQDFRKAVSLSTVRNEQDPATYLEKAFQRFYATRFYEKSADKLATMLSVFQDGRTSLFDGLSHEDDVFQTRDELIQRCSIFGLKSVSDFMITVGLSHDVIALDTRVTGIFQRYFDYNLSSGQIQSNRRIYFSLEAALREVCQDRQVSLALLDRLLFNFGDLSVIELVARHPELIDRLREKR